MLVRSVLIVFGTPFRFLYCSEILTAVWPSVVLQKTGCRPFTKPVHREQNIKSMVLLGDWTDEIQLDFFVRFT